MGLVWALVGTEPCVAIDAIGAVLNGQMGYVGVELPYGFNQFPAKLIPSGEHRLITLLVGCKPLLIIVARQVAQKIYYIFHFFYVFCGQR